MKIILTTDQLMRIIAHIQQLGKARVEMATQIYLETLTEQQLEDFASIYGSQDTIDKVNAAYPVIETAGELIDLIDKL